MSGKKKHNASVAAVVSVSLFAFSGGALAAPTGGAVAKGAASIDQNGLQTLITQTTGKAVINWDDFSINADELVKFIHQSSSDVTLNRVTGDTVSQIKGALTANGNIFLINPNGIVFGATAQVDVAGLVATTFDIADQDFMDGKFNFTGDMMSNASIRNEGELKVGEGGFVYLIAPNVENTGHIIANVGTVTLGADGNYLIGLQGDGLIKFSVSEETLTSATSSVANSGTIEAGHVLLSGSQTSAVISSVVNTGNIKAATSLTLSGSSVDNRAGTLELDVKSGDSHDQIVLQSDSSSGTVDFKNNSLSTSGEVDVGGTIKVTNSTGGVTLDKVEVNGDLSVTAAGNIIGGGNLDTAARGERVTLATTVDGATIGAENNALRIDAEILRAEAQKGHVIITDTGGDLTLERVSTGDNSGEAALRALLTAEDGDLRGSNGAEANVEAWATNLKADGAIGDDGQAVTTAVGVLSASTQDGGIYVDEQDGAVLLGKVSAGERINLGGEIVSSTGVGAADGSVTLSSGATGSHDVLIDADGDIAIGEQISATDELSLRSRNGGIEMTGNSAIITGRFIYLEAADRIGHSESAVKTQSNALHARSGRNGIYLTEDNGLTAAEILSSGENAAVELQANLGDVVLGLVDAVDAGVSVVSQRGDILADGGAPLNVRGDNVTLDADGAIGTAARALNTEVGSLTTATGTSLAGTYVANTGLLSSLDVTTLGGNVAVTDDDGGVTFNRADERLAVQRDGGEGLDLAFNNSAGNLVVEGADLSGHDVNLTASGRIDDGGGVFAADALTLNAGDDIELTTDANTIGATTAAGDIALENQGPGTLTLNAKAGGAGHGITVSHQGDLSLGQVSADGPIRLTAAGALNGDGDSTAITGKDVALDAARIGSDGEALSTAITGKLSMLSDGDIYVTNVGALSMLEGDAGGDIDFSQAGDTVLGRLASGGSVTFYATGRVSDGNGNDDNIIANDLNLDAQQVGAADGIVDALEIRVDELVINASNGGIYLRNRDNGPLSLISARAAGGGMDIDTVGNMNLGTVTASGGNVTLTSGGAINDARPDGASEANVVARKVDMRAQQGIGNTGPMILDVDQMSVSGGNGDVNAASPGAVEVDADSLVGKGVSGVTIVAASITVLDNNGGTLIMDGGKLVLTATNGNIVFLNQDDTIRLPGGGSITLTARTDTTNEGYNGNIITGNLVTEGGDITLDADRNVTLGMLDTGGTGDVYVIARDGVILDGNGADQNVRGDYVTLIGNTPTERDAEIVRDTAIADYAGRVAELNAKILQLQTLQQQFEAYINAVNSAIVGKNISQQNLRSAQRTVDQLSSQLSAAEGKLNSLNRTVTRLSLGIEAASIASGAAQAIPMTGDGGASGILEGLALALSAAQYAVDEYDRNTFSPLADEVNEAMNDLDVAKSYHRDALTNVESWTTMRDTTRVSRDMADQSVFKATAARDASQALRHQSIAAYDQAQDIDMSAATPLGIQANRLDMGTSSGRALNSGVYLDSTGDIGLGDIKADGEIRVADVVGDISVVGDVVSPSLISLDAGGAVRGVGGTWVNGDWVPQAGVLHASAIALRAAHGVANDVDSLHTDTGEIAIDAGTGDAFVINDNGGDELVLGTVDGLNGLTAAGDMGLRNRGDLRLKTQIVDTVVDADSDTYLYAEGGAIIDDNGDTLNVIGGDLHFRADGRVELDIQVDRVVDSGTSDGDVLLREHDDLTLIALEALNGDIDVTAAGDLILHELAAGGDSAIIRLGADGRIDDDQDNSTGISGRRLELTAGGGIGATGANEVRGLDTAVDVVTASAKGEINLHDQDGLDVEKVTTTTGNVTLTSGAGDLRLGEVRTDGEDANITLVAAGAIDALNAADDTPELYADQLALRAGAGIGRADQPLLIETGALEADAGNGGLYLLNQNRDLTVGGVTPNLGLPGLTGLDANGDLHLAVADGAVTVNENVTQTGEGDTWLTSGDDMTVNAGMQAAGDLDMQSGGNLTINGQTLTADGNLMGLAEGDMTLAANSLLDAGHGLGFLAGGAITATDSTLTSGTAGDLGEEDINDLLLLTQSGDITLTRTTGTAAGGIQVGAGTGFAAIQPMGRIPSAPPVASVTLANSTLEALGDDLALRATGDITLTPASQATATENLSASAGGNIALAQGSGLTATAGAIDAEAGNRIAIADSAAHAGTSVSFDADQADIAIDNGNVTAGTDLSLTAGTDVSAINGSRVDAGDDMVVTAGAGDITITNSALTADGDLDLLAGGLIQLNTATLISGVAPLITFAPAPMPRIGDMTLTANSGDIVLTNGTQLQSSGETTLDAQAASIEANNGSSITAATDLTLKASNDIGLNSGVSLQASTGDLAMAASEGDIDLRVARVSAGGELTGTAGQGITLTNGSHAQAGIGMTLDAQGADLTLNNSSTAIAAIDTALKAKGSVLLDNGAVAEAHGGDLSISATDGDITLSNAAQATAGGTLAADAGDSITLTDALAVSGTHDVGEPAPAQEDSGMTLTADRGDITLTRSQTQSGGDLTGTAGQNIGLTDANATAVGAAVLTAGTDEHNGTDADLTLDNSHVAANGGYAALTAADSISLQRASTVVAHDDLSVDAQTGDVTLIENSSLAAQNGSMDLDAGSRVGVTDSILSAGIDMTVDAAAADIALGNSHATAGNDLALTAGTDVTLVNDSHADANGGNLSMTGSGGDVRLTDSVTSAYGTLDLIAGTNVGLTRSSGTSGDDMILTADRGDITLTRSQTQSGGDLIGNAGQDINLDDSVADASSDLTLGAGGSITLTDTSGDGDTVGSTITAQAGDLSLTAGDSIALDSASHGIGYGDVTANAEQGALTVIDSSLLYAETGSMDLDAGNAVSFTDSSATAATSMTVDAANAGIALNNSQATAGTDLSLDASTDITLTDSEATDTTGSTLLAQAGDLSLKAGNDIALDSASSGVAHGDVTANAEAGDLTVIEQSSLTAQTGKMDLNAGSRVGVTDSTLSAGTDMTVDAAAADIALDNATATVGTDLAMTARTDIILDGSSVTATAGDMDLAATDGDITVNHSHVKAKGELTGTAGTDIALTDSSAEATDANLSLTGMAGDVQLTDSTATAGNDLALVADGDVTLTRGSASAHGNVSLSAGNAVSQTDHSLTATTGTLLIDALNGAITQSGTSTATSAGNLDLDAAHGVTITRLASGTDLTVKGGQGGIDMAAGSLASANGDVTMTTDGDIDLTRVQAGGDAILTSNKGGINASDAISENVTGQNVFLSTAQSIGSALSGLKTKVGNLYATITGSGSLYMDEADALTVKEVELADGDAYLTTGGNLTIDSLAANGNVTLDSAGNIHKGRDSLVSADNLDAKAVTGIDLNTDLTSANLSVTGSGDIDLTNQEALTLDQASTEDGYINIAAGGDLGVGQVAASGEHSVKLASSGAIEADGEGRIDSRDVTLNASEGIGAAGALSLNAADLTAITDNGDIRLDQTGTVALNTVRTGDGEIAMAVHDGDAILGDIRADGDVSLSAADGSLANDNDTTTYVGGDRVTLASADGIGVNGAIDTRANRIDAGVSDNGNINIAERDGLAGLNASAANGNVKVSTATGNLTVDQVKALSPGNAVMLLAEGGSILDGNGDANNIVASLLRIVAAQGIARASDPLDVRVASLAADGGSGGVYINNGSSDPLSVIGLTGKGSIGLTTDGDLDLAGTVSGTGVSLHAGGDVVQGGNISSASYANVYGQGDVTMMPYAQTTATTDVTYHAGDELTVNEIATTGGLSGGRIRLEGRTFKSNADDSGSLSGGAIQFNLTNTGGLYVEQLVNTTIGKSRVWVNGRTQGGKITEDSQYVADLLSPPGALPTVFYKSLSTPSSTGFQQDPDNANEWHYNP